MDERRLEKVSFVSLPALAETMFDDYGTQVANTEEDQKRCMS